MNVRQAGSTRTDQEKWIRGQEVKAVLNASCNPPNSDVSGMEADWCSQKTGRRQTD